jgi:iron complex transport system substrate-binding protein
MTLFRHISISLILSFLIFSPPLSAAMTVTDQLGRKVTIPDSPQRVVSLAPNITEIIFSLHMGHLLKGVTTYSDYPAEALVLPKVGSYINLDLERIVALRPDICIAIKDGNPIAVVQRLEALNIPLYAVNPMNLETVMQTVLEIGTLLNARAMADKLVRDMSLELERLKALVKKADNHPRVFFQIGTSPIVSVGTDTFIHELIVLAGGTNIASGPIPYPRFSREQILALSPEVIIITSMVQKSGFEQIKAEWEDLGMPAAKNKNIYFVNADFFNRPTPRLVQGLELLIKIIHPELSELFGKQ